ncbi:MAG TPA: hypothetical protein VM284_06420 [Candidatus Limnocylindria bacterium]|nr:hypothetical protein [Candidatus Limnocylindria bacterium]
MIRPSKIVLIVTAALLATMVVAAPAAAVSQSGFESKVRCYNRTVSGDIGQELELRRLLVLPPTLYTKSASAGWRFIVYRSSDGLDYTVRYRSPIQRAPSSSGFTSMGVPVAVPSVWPSPDPEAYPYRVVIKAFFYRADGSIKATSKSDVYEFRIWVDGEYASRNTSVCYGRTRLDS